MTTLAISPRIGAAAIALAFLAGCTTFSKDGGFDAVSSAASERIGKDAVVVRTDADREAVDQRTKELLGKPLSMDDAVQVALLNNRGLQASYAELGLSEADLVQAGRLMTISMLKRLAGFAAATAIFAGAPVAASAHGKLERAVPAAGGTVDAAPDTVRLTFNEDLEPAFSSVKVSDASGNTVTQDKAKVDASNPRVMTVAIPKLAAGAYT
ncbi:copper resistance CopC family protein, partial [Burkholderia sola]|uniref:copper resistance CopC family protein n=1 Tax=Burkholderia sola TaxID=2843302 RepID=UPI0023DE156C